MNVQQARCAPSAFGGKGRGEGITGATDGSEPPHPFLDVAKESSPLPDGEQSIEMSKKLLSQDQALTRMSLGSRNTRLHIGSASRLSGLFLGRHGGGRTQARPEPMRIRAQDRFEEFLNGALKSVGIQKGP